ncbi:MAG: PPK2 family polyphosphate:nucleotide phosphotransferase [Polyangiales bacterium]|jgi:PPK2 family polyphosphate:nucleotide phosphotransferase
MAKKSSLASAVKSPYLVPFDGKWRLKDADHKPPKNAPSGKSGKNKNKKSLAKEVDSLRDLQERLYADDHYSVLLVFQAMDAAGKDGTIRAVMSGINPAGCQVVSFKRPSSNELDHDFLWRVHSKTPERGRIGVFNRSHYEEVLVVKVNPGILDSQRLPQQPKSVFEDRYESIRDFEEHLARNGTVVIKFFLNVSRDEQKERFLARIADPEKNWKFEAADLDVREDWDEYMKAYQEALNETSRPHAPWYVIPADDKPFMRTTVAGIVRKTLEKLDLKFPKLSDEEMAELGSYKEALENE